MSITAADVNKLRQMTGAGMMDCKKALTEAEGDFEAAIDVLRKAGQKVAAKRADNATNEGVVLVALSADHSNGKLIALACETEPVSKVADFNNLAQSIIDKAAASHAPSAHDLLAEPLADGRSVEGHIIELTGRIGENVSEIGKDIAMQITAMKPVALDKDGVDAETIEREIEIGKDQARQEGKPEAMLEKIAVGKLEKFYREQTLLNQQFVKDSSITIRQLLENKQKGLTISMFKRISLV